MGKDKNPSFFSRKGGGNRLVNDLTDAELGQLPVENITWAQAQPLSPRQFSASHPISS
jgi:hypothetical protein